MSHCAEIERLIRQAPAVALYFTGPDCGVCQALWPKVEALLQREFPRIQRRRIELALQPELAAQRQVFSVPTLLFYFDGRETQRFGRSFSLQQVCDAIQRPYGLFFD